MNLTHQQQPILAQLRCGVLPIKVEMGWYTNTKRENWFYDICNKNKIEGELHFILGCTYYSEERRKFLSNISIKSKNYSVANKFKCLCEEYPRKLAKYLTQICLKRKSALCDI